MDNLIDKNNEILSRLLSYSDNVFKKYLSSNSKDKITLKECSNICTGKLNAEVATTNGKYPFFTCKKEELLIDEYAFDCEAIIIAGNGEISCKYYNGKFNAYQRTYVLTPNQYFYLFQKMCEFNIKNLNIKNLIKLNMKKKRNK